MQPSIFASLHALVGQWRVVAYAWSSAIPARSSRAWGWAVVGLVFLGQICLFVRFAEREVTCAYPPAFDQVGYLLQTYTLADHMRADGMFTALGQELVSGLVGNTANGTLLQIQAAAVCVWTGSSRPHVLLVNLAYLLLFELALVGVLRHFSRGWSVPLAGLGLVLSATTAFQYPGGMFDFRLDFAAMCLFGTFMCAVLRSGPFEHRGWCAVAGLVGGALVLERVITALYVAGVLAVMLSMLAARLAWRRLEPAARARVRRRLGGAILTSACLAVIAFPYMMHIRQALFDYYVVGHVLGPERNIRIREAGTTNILAHLAYYPSTLLRDQLGKRFQTLCLLTLLIAGVAWYRARSACAASLATLGDVATPAVFLAACLFVPGGILLIHACKSLVVSSILVPGVVGLVLASLLVASRLVDRVPRPTRLGAVLVALATFSVGCGVYVQVKYQYRSDLFGSRTADTIRLVDLFDTLRTTSAARHWPQPIIGIDEVSEKLNHGIARLMLYERYGSWQPICQSLGGSIFAIDQAEALAEAQRSDFVICTRAKNNYRSPYPFDQCMQNIRPTLVAWCKSHLDLLSTVSLVDRDVELYVRRPAVATSDSDSKQR
jgi:hypothetical protein